MIEYIIRTILLILFLALVCIVSIVTIRINHVKCPKCGTDMYYIGNDNNFGVLNGLPNQLKHHYYRCPKCGEIKII